VKADQSKVKAAMSAVITAPSQKSRYQYTYKISALTNTVIGSQATTKIYCIQHSQADSPMLDCAKNPDAYSWKEASLGGLHTSS